MAPILIAANSPVMAHCCVVISAGPCVIKVGFTTSYCSSVEAMMAVVKLATRLTDSRTLKMFFS